MRCIYKWLFLVVVVCAACESKNVENTNEADKLLLLEKQWLEKEFILDTAFISSLIDSSFIDVTETGLKHKKEDLIGMYNNMDKQIKKGVVIDSFRLEDEVVNMYSNSAVVTFVVHTFNHHADTSIERRTRFYDVWVKKGNEWKAVASQGTPLSKEIKPIQN